MARRRCGCPFERAGWSTHLHTIRSFEKLTAGGMTFLGTDVIRVLEEALPGQFGGGPADYQLVEEEGPNGSARLRLLVHPDVGPLDAAAVEHAFIAALSNGSGPERVMGLAWREPRLIRVELRAPLATASGRSSTSTSTGLGIRGIRCEVHTLTDRRAPEAPYYDLKPSGARRRAVLRGTGASPRCCGPGLAESIVVPIVMRCHYPAAFDALILRHDFSVVQRWGGYAGERYGAGRSWSSSSPRLAMPASPPQRVVYP